MATALGWKNSSRSVRGWTTCGLQPRQRSRPWPQSNSTAVSFTDRNIGRAGLGPAVHDEASGAPVSEGMATTLKLWVAVPTMSLAVMVTG